MREIKLNDEVFLNNHYKRGIVVDINSESSKKIYGINHRNVTFYYYACDVTLSKSANIQKLIKKYSGKNKL